MNRITKNMKKNKDVLEELVGEKMLGEVLAKGKKALDGAIWEIGQMIVETLLIMDREESSGYDYNPVHQDLRKWGFQKGSVYVGNAKVRVNHPRLRNKEKEVPLRLYERLKKPEEFSEEMLVRALRGLSGRKYKETVIGLANGFGLSGSSWCCSLLDNPWAY